MAKIGDLKKVDLSKVPDELAQRIDEFLKDYDQLSETPKIRAELSENIKIFYDMVKEFSPEAIPDNKKKAEEKVDESQRKPEKSKSQKTQKKEGVKTEKQEPKEAVKKPEARPPSKKKKENTAEPKDNKELLEQLKALEPKLENCRRVIREHNAQKREAQGPKPKPTRHTQLKQKLLAIVSLIPEKFIKDSKVLERTEEILLDAHSQLMEVWGMDKVKGKPAASAIQEKFDSIEEKQLKEERKKLAKRWKTQLPDVDTLMRKEWKDSDGLESEAKDILDDLKQAIKLFEQDPKKANEFLTKRYSQEQLGRHLPDFIAEQLGIK